MLYKFDLPINIVNDHINRVDFTYKENVLRCHYKEVEIPWNNLGRNFIKDQKAKKVNLIYIHYFGSAHSFVGYNQYFPSKYKEQNYNDYSEYDHY